MTALVIDFFLSGKNLIKNLTHQSKIKETPKLKSDSMMY